MTPNKKGQGAKFHTPISNIDTNQRYVILEIINNADAPMAAIQAISTGLSSAPIQTISLTSLEVAQINTQDLIGEFVTICKSDYSQVEGKVINVSEQIINIDLSQGLKGVEKNVWLTIVDKYGEQHLGISSIN